MKRKLSQSARQAIIKFLVEQEQPSTKAEAKAIALEWQDKTDQMLIEANNYNLTQIERQQETANV